MDDTNELKRGAPVLLAATIGMMLGLSAVPFYTLSVFAGPVTEATGWTMAQFQFAFTCMSVGVLMGPVVGSLMDRHSTRLIVISNIAIFGFAMMAIGVAGGLGLVAFYAAWVIMAVGSQATGPIGWTHVLRSWFDRRRGIAFGIALSGSGIFAFFGPPLAARFIAAFGWQGAYVALGALVLAISLPISLMFLKERPALDPDKPASIPDSITHFLKDYRFWLLSAVFCGISFCVSGMISNLVTIFEITGIDRAQGAALAGLVGISVLIARIITGWFLDRFWPPAVAAVTLTLPVLSCLVMIGVVPAPAALAAILLGFAAGAEFDVLAYMVSRYFPPEAYGRVYGMTYLALFGGAALAPPIFGANYDAAGDYDTILMVAAAIYLIAPITLLALGKVRYSAGHG